MHSKASLAIVLIAMLLADSLLAVNWQGTGSGMNNTVISEIWRNLVPNLETATRNNAYNPFVNDIATRLNNRWDPAWNVVLVTEKLGFDAILYGYAFRNQWMWYNGVPNTYLSSRTITLIVWKDYNCR